MFLSIIIPVYNEEENLVELYQRLDKTIKTNDYTAEVILVDDGSDDKSYAILKNLYQKDKRIKIIKLKKNFGQIPAILAGIKLARGDTVITLDADLQNPPEEIPKFVEKINQGFSAVFGYRITRKDYFLRKICSFVFWQLISLKTKKKIKDPGCGFNAIKKDLIDKIIKKYGENLKNIKHMIAKETNSVTQVAVSHFKRERGKSKYSFLRLVSYALSFLKEIFLKNFTKNNLLYEIEEILG
ncbi:MAG: glycosyltransferase family 2 protein [Candidatus Omnitrophota bacterium]